MPTRTLPQAIAALERQAIADALAATGGNKLAAARRLGISRATLYEKLRLLGVQAITSRAASTAPTTTAPTTAAPTTAPTAAPTTAPADSRP